MELQCLEVITPSNHFPTYFDFPSEQFKLILWKPVLISLV